MSVVSSQLSLVIGNWLEISICWVVFCTDKLEYLMGQ